MTETEEISDDSPDTNEVYRSTLPATAYICARAANLIETHGYERQHDAVDAEGRLTDPTGDDVARYGLVGAIRRAVFDEWCALRDLEEQCGEDMRDLPKLDAIQEPLLSAVISDLEETRKSIYRQNLTVWAYNASDDDVAGFLKARAQARITPYGLLRGTVFRVDGIEGDWRGYGYDKNCLFTESGVAGFPLFTRYNGDRLLPALTQSGEVRDYRYVPETASYTVTLKSGQSVELKHHLLARSRAGMLLYQFGGLQLKFEEVSEW